MEQFLEALKSGRRDQTAIDVALCAPTGLRENLSSSISEILDAEADL